MRPHIGFLLGSPPGRSSVLAGVVERLCEAGARVEIERADSGRVPHALMAADVVALRALTGSQLGLAWALEDAGLRCCNSAAATAAARHKAVMLGLIRAVGVPAPAFALAAGWPEARAVAGGRPVVAKAVTGSRGASVLLAPDGRLPDEPPFPGPYLVEELLPHRGPDRKVFVVGRRIAGVLRRWPPRGLRDKRGRPFEPTDEEASAALRVGTALGLEVFGVDFVTTGRGSVVVDVNAFPGFKGVPQSERWLAEHLLAVARERRGTCAR